MRACRAIGLAVVVAAFPPRAAGQAAGLDGPVVLRTPSSVRATGLNNAGAALMGDAAAVFANPAGLALIPHVALELGYFGGALDAYQATAALGFRFGQLNIGGGLKYFDFGTEPEVVPDPATGGVTGTPTGASVSAHELLGVGSVIYRVGLLAFGGSVKLVEQGIAGLQETGVSGDLGLAIAIFDLAAFGFAVQNVGGNWSDQSPLVFPRLTRFGFTMNYVDPQETYRLLSTLELQWPAGRSTRFVAGVEGGMVVRGVGLLGRAAYGTREAGEDLSRLTVGASFTLGRLTVDYAYEPTDLLVDGSQRIGLRLAL